MTSDNTGDKVNDSTFNTDYNASAYDGSISAVVQGRHGVMRPLASLNFMPFRIARSIQDGPTEHFNGETTTLTFALMFVSDHVQFGPYATVTNFESGLFKGGFFRRAL